MVLLNKVLGFTGTRHGCTPKQKASLANIVQDLFSRGVALYAVHGDCVGADAQFSDACRSSGYDVSCRPCTMDSLRAHTGDKERAKPERPMQRNQKIVDDADCILACPPGFNEEVRSGTWATIRMARRARKPLIIILPDGTLKSERWVTDTDTLFSPDSSSGTTLV